MILRCSTSQVSKDIFLQGQLLNVEDDSLDLMEEESCQLLLIWELLELLGK